MKKYTLSLSLLLLLAASSFSYEYLNLVHVDQWGWNEPGYIDSAALLVKPKGLYAECELIIDFSSEGAGYFDEDVLEVEMEFNLSQESDITDLYLWIEDEPVRAYIFDTWTANLIYESIVQRRIDPAILIKKGPGRYNLKVYPIVADMPRRIKIHYITPVDNIMGTTQSLALPFNILNLSYDSPEKFKIAFIETEEYGTPGFLEEEDLEFQTVNDPDFGICIRAELTNLLQRTSGTLVYKRKSQTNDCHAKVFESEDTGEKFYELALNHSELIGLTNQKKAVFLLDFMDDNCTSYNVEELLESLKFSIHNTFGDADSFNILISGLESFFLSDNWIPGDSASIEAHFNNLYPGLFNDYSNLPSVLFDGINFIQNNSNAGSLILIASSNSHGDSDQANSLITDFMEFMGEKEIPIHVINLDDNNYSYSQMHYIGGQYFRGNEYFYTRLSQMTTGEYNSILNNSLSALLEQAGSRASGYFKSLEIFVQTDGGYSFSNYRLNHSGGLIYNNEALQLIGKYIGNAPFYVSLYGQNSTDEVFHFEQTILPGDIQEGDSTIELCWTANYLKELMGMEQNNQIVNQIINTSIDHRILSDYTAFLVLEPDFEIPDDPDNADQEDDFWVTAAEEMELKSEKTVSLTNYPNPFDSFTEIAYTIPRKGKVSLSIYSLAGRLIEILVNEELEKGDYTFELEASGYEKGIYFCILELDGQAIAKLKIAVM
ncbi:MAG: T9SS type A sorting domain-containing protein [Bacteroidales bacterium]|jgi:hypothetical protein